MNDISRRDVEELDVVVVGALNADLWMRVPRLPKPGETLGSTETRLLPGGKGSNQAVGLARLGLTTALVGCVGRDSNGDMLMAALAAEGVATETISVVEQATGVAVVLAEADASNTIILGAGANAAVNQARVLESERAISRARAVLISLEVPMRAAVAAAQLARGLVVLNAAPAQALPSELLAQVDVLVVNSVELAQLCGIESLPEDLGSLPTLAADLLSAVTLVVTLGESGAAVVWVDGVTLVPAVPVSAVDTTGGGDSFCAALTYGLLAGMELVAAVRYATAAAANAVLSHGAMTGLPTVEQVGKLHELALSIPEQRLHRTEIKST